MRRLTAQELEQALAFKLVVTARGCEVHDDQNDCDGPVQSCHLIPKQALRRRGLYESVYDPRNGIGACYLAHRRSDAGLKRFPADRIPGEAWAFARELGLDWLLEKLYGKDPGAPTASWASAPSSSPGADSGAPQVPTAVAK